ncbi:hypothetical protein Tco_0567567 [Tanacetum coccineum]
MAAVCFMQLLELQLLKKHRKDYLKDVENEQFELHYPPIKYVGTANKNFLIRCLPYLPPPFISVMFGFRAYLEHQHEFSEFYGHLFQVGLLVISEVGTLAVYVLAKGVGSNLVGKIDVMKLFMFIIWLEVCICVYVP